MIHLVVRRGLLFAFVVVLAAGVGLAVRELTGAAWLARVPPTATPFVSASPLTLGAQDPFADIPALPRLEQFTTGGALEISLRTGSSKRVRSADGGWSLEMPADWRADVGRLRGGEIYSFDPTGIDASGNEPPPDGVRMSVLLWPDFEMRGPAWLADHEGQPYPGSTRQRGVVTLNGFTAERALMRENQPRPLDVTVARWYVRHPSFEDRVLGIVLVRADTAALTQAERVLATLELFAPVSGPRRPLLTRAEAIAKVASGRAAKPTPAPAISERIEAKLVTFKEYERAQGRGQSFGLDADTPIWVVVGFGDFEPSPRSQRGPGPFPRWTWQFSELDARTGQGFGGGGGPAGTEPAWWASLRDRAQ